MKFDQKQRLDSINLHCVSTEMFLNETGARLQVHVSGRHGVRPGEFHLCQLVRNRLPLVDALLRQEPAAVPAQRGRRGQKGGRQRHHRGTVRAAAQTAAPTGSTPLTFQYFDHKFS